LRLQAFRAHKEPIRDITFCPTGQRPCILLVSADEGCFADVKFATASDDKAISIWDFERGTEDLNLTGTLLTCVAAAVIRSLLLAGHGWDVKTVCWHPQKGLLLSGIVALCLAA
jgi:polyadenylation factor subunit 2